MTELVSLERLPEWVPGRILLAGDGLGWRNIGLRAPLRAERASAGRRRRGGRCVVPSGLSGAFAGGRRRQTKDSPRRVT